MEKVIGVRFRNAGKIYFFSPGKLDIPKGKHVIRICDGTACHVRKSVPILEALRKELGLTEKK